MDNPTNQPGSPFGEVVKKQFTFSMSTLLLLVVVFSVVCASMLAAFQMPAVRNEIDAMLGVRPSVESGGRHLQFIFVMFCYCGPLLLAAIVNLILITIRWIKTNYANTQPQSEPLSPFDD